YSTKKITNMKLQIFILTILLIEYGQCGVKDLLELRDLIHPTTTTPQTTATVMLGDLKKSNKLSELYFGGLFQLFWLVDLMSCVCQMIRNCTSKSVFSFQAEVIRDMFNVLSMYLF
ncbi:hypothetical protein EWB00_008311, partial [Schistosoma japonicum]